ncbi:MAG: hypothetical protein GWQ08_10265 [Verrucomicrobiaceae bacterium]|nr:hypothetical protein [Verrucomicrobiaceae bacterium]
MTSEVVDPAKYEILVAGAVGALCAAGHVSFPANKLCIVAVDRVMGMKVDEVGQAIACINLETADLFVAVRYCDLLSDCLGGLKGA